MTAEELWQKCKAEKSITADKYEAWAFGSVPDELLALVLAGEKTGTASPYDLYAVEGDALPRPGDYSVLLDSAGEAHCVIRTTKVRIVPFDEVTPEHARAEGEGDKSLAYWREVHEKVMRRYFDPYCIPFSGQSRVVCEEFEVVYRG